MNRYDYLKGTHDLPSLSDWGPYARDLYCLSHIADKKNALRIDFCLVPGVLMRKSFLPETLRESECSPLEAAPDLSYFSFRQQFEGQDSFYSDLAYGQIGENLWLGRCEFVNNTQELRACSLFSFARILSGDEVVPHLPANARWIDAVSYQELTYSYSRFDYNLVHGGGRRGEQQYPGTVGGRCIGQPPLGNKLPCFGAKPGDRVIYEFPAQQGDGALFLRFRAEKGEKISFLCRLNGKESRILFAGTGKFTLTELYRGALKGKIRLELTACEESGGVRLDGFVIGDKTLTARKIRFSSAGKAIAPSFTGGKVENSGTLSAKGLKQSYGIWHSLTAGASHEAWIGDTEKMFNYSYGLRRRTTKVLWEYPGENYYQDSYMLPVEVPSHGHAVVYTLYCTGENPAEAERKIADLNRSSESIEQLYLTAKARAMQFHPAPGGKVLEFTQKITAATDLTNINFPIRTQGENIRHHVPDKYFNSLYQWDSGFIGLGLLELDKTRAVENLNVYLTDPAKDENAFVFYGTPMPTQAYLYAELWNRFQDKELLEYFYPGAKYFYRFIAGHIPTSSYRTAKSNLLRSWNYSYNSGGWDDYPPQWYIHLHGNRTVAPAVTTAHAIRFAKILRRATQILGRKEDITLYNDDITAFTDALQRYSWSEKDGIFSYVEHDEEGNPKGFWLDPESGVNFNFGMDGVSPLVSGICTPHQRQLLFDRLADPQGMWTNSGISTVDRRAPYYRTEGYWNGSVWMPHQWFYWKAALDDNRGEFARKIADTALTMWHREVRKSRYTFEYFSILNQRGAGCCHFGGLSSPVLNWYGAYYELNRLTAGFDTWFKKISVSSNTVCAELETEGTPGEFCTVLFVSGGGKWSAEYNGQKVPFVQGLDTTLEITLPKSSAGTLILQKQ